MPYKDPEKQRAFQREHARAKRARFTAGLSCSWCGSDERIEFHHRDPNSKLTHKLWTFADERIVEELRKCIALCRACHQRAHSEARRIEAELRNPHGTYRRYKLGCKCRSCRDANRDYQRERIANLSTANGSTIGSRGADRTRTGARGPGSSYKYGRLAEPSEPRQTRLPGDDVTMRATRQLSADGDLLGALLGGLRADEVEA